MRMSLWVAAMVLAASSDSFSGYAGVQLRASPGKIDGFSKNWSEAREPKLLEYTYKGTPPDFEGQKVDKAVVQVSKKLQVVVGLAFRLTGDHCLALIKTLNAKWGEAFVIGGSNHELQWQGSKVDASLENDGPGACMFYVGDLGYDDTRDDWKPKR